jgi:hypothetical protein
MLQAGEREMMFPSDPVHGACGSCLFWYIVEKEGRLLLRKALFQNCIPKKEGDRERKEMLGSLPGDKEPTSIVSHAVNETAGNLLSGKHSFSGTPPSKKTS